MKKRILPIIFCILLLLPAALPVFAAETGSIAVLLWHDNQPVTGAAFKIYKAAEWNGDGYSLAEPFSGYSVKMADDSSSEEWKALASTLAAYAARDEIAPLTTGETDEDGELCFEGLSDGLYLLTGGSIVTGEQRLFPQPMLVSVPYTTADGEKVYDVVAEPKYDTQKISEITLTRRALKIWKDEGNEDERPQEVTVQLLCDGEIYDEQVLNAANNWSHAWENLDASHNWQLVEKEVPKHYTVTVTQQDVTFVVVNTGDNPPPPDDPTLPQTGMLWWPVPVLAATGAVSLFFGIFLLIRKKDGSDA